MTIQFTHKGKPVTAKIVIYFNAINEAVIVFPDSNLGELGWSIFFLQRGNKWTTESFLKEKYPTTYLSLLSQLNLFKRTFCIEMLLCGDSFLFSSERQIECSGLT